MADKRSSIIIDLAGNIASRARSFTRALSDFSLNGQRSLGMLSRSATVLGNGIDRMSSRYTALAYGFGGTMAIRFLASFDQRITQLGVNMEMTNDQLDTLKSRIFDVARMPNIRVDPSELLGAVEEIVKQTGDLKLAQDNLENIGLVMRATGADATSAGAMVANLMQKFNIRDAKTIREVISSWALQGKAGAFELRDLATEGNEVAAAFAMTGQQGKKAALEMGAILQMVRRTTPSADEAATSFTRLMQTLTSEKVKELQAHGIQIWDPEKLEQGVKIARPIPDIIKDILKATKGDPEILGQIFDIRALRAINAFAIELKNTGNLSDFNKFLKMDDTSGSILSKDSATNAKSIAASWEAIVGTFQKGITNDTGAIRTVMNFLASMKPGTADTLFNVAGGIAAVLGALVVGRGLFKMGRGLFNAGKFIISGGKKSKGGIAGALGDGLTPVPVYIVNSPTLAREMGNATGTRLAGRLGRLQSLIGKAGLLATAGSLGYGVGTVADKELQKTSTGLAIRENIGRVVALAMIPFSSDARTALAKDMKDRLAKVESIWDKYKFKGDLHIQIDSNGRPAVKKMSTSSPDMTMTVTNGQMMGASG